MTFTSSLTVELATPCARGAEARGDDSEEQAEDGVDVEEDRAQHEGLGLGLVQELPLVHHPIVAHAGAARAPEASARRDLALVRPVHSVGREAEGRVETQSGL